MAGAAKKSTQKKPLHTLVGGVIEADADVEALPDVPGLPDGEGWQPVLQDFIVYLEILGGSWLTHARHLAVASAPLPKALPEETSLANEQRVLERVIHALGSMENSRKANLSKEEQ